MILSFDTGQSNHSPLHICKCKEPNTFRIRKVQSPTACLTCSTKAIWEMSELIYQQQYLRQGANYKKNL